MGNFSIILNYYFCRIRLHLNPNSLIPKRRYLACAGFDQGTFVDKILFSLCHGLSVKQLFNSVKFEKLPFRNEIPGHFQPGNLPRINFIRDILGSKHQQSSKSWVQNGKKSDQENFVKQTNCYCFKKVEECPSLVSKHYYTIQETFIITV